MIWMKIRQLNRSQRSFVRHCLIMWSWSNKQIDGLFRELKDMWIGFPNSRRPSKVVEVPDTLWPGFIMMETYFDPVYGNVCQIAYVYVRPSYRQQGVATEMINSVKRKFPKRVILVGTFPQNIAATQLYSKIGFVKEVVFQLTTVN